MKVWKEGPGWIRQKIRGGRNLGRDYYRGLAAALSTRAAPRLLRRSTSGMLVRKDYTPPQPRVTHGLSRPHPSNARRRYRARKRAREALL